MSKGFTKKSVYERFLRDRYIGWCRRVVAEHKDIETQRAERLIAANKSDRVLTVMLVICGFLLGMVAGAML